MRRRHPTHSDAASSNSAILKFIHTVQALFNMQAQYKGQYSGLPNRGWGVGIPRLLHMAWYPSGHKGLDLKSCVSASIWLVGSNPTHAAASQRSLHVAMLFSLILYIRSVGQAAKTWDFQSQNRVSITLRSTKIQEMNNLCQWEFIRQKI